MQNTRLPTLDFDLGPEIDMLRTTVRGFAEDHIAPLAAEIDRTDRFPVELWPEMGALGLHGIGRHPFRPFTPITYPSGQFCYQPIRLVGHASLSPVAGRGPG